MKPLPKQVEPVLLQGLDLADRGKVCELYHLPGYPNYRLKVISDRASVHDIILPFHVPGKGIVLNLVDHFWRRQFPGIKHDVVSIGPPIDAFLPKHLRGNPDLHRRARVIRVCDGLEMEGIFRGELTGTGWKKYQKDAGVICGQQFPPGLKEWDSLIPSAFTPTTKSREGHDEHMDIQQFIERFGQQPIDLMHPVFETGRRIARERGLNIADTKFELGKDPAGELVLIDEILTPDSSRFMTIEALEEARRTGKKPPSFDKQPMRDYVWENLGVGAETELTIGVVAKVHGHTYPEEIIKQTANRYKQLIKLLTGKTAEEYFANPN